MLRGLAWDPSFSLDFLGVGSTAQMAPSRSQSVSKATAPSSCGHSKPKHTGLPQSEEQKSATVCICMVLGVVSFVVIYNDATNQDMNISERVFSQFQQMVMLSQNGDLCSGSHS